MMTKFTLQGFFVDFIKLATNFSLSNSVPELICSSHFLVDSVKLQSIYCSRTELLVMTFAQDYTNNQRPLYSASLNGHLNKIYYVESRDHTIQQMPIVGFLLDLIQPVTIAPHKTLDDQTFSNRTRSRFIQSYTFDLANSLFLHMPKDSRNALPSLNGGRGAIELKIRSIRVFGTWKLLKFLKLVFLTFLLQFCTGEYNKNTCRQDRFYSKVQIRGR